MPIETPADLRAHVALAINVELSTIPLYLYALYSIEDDQSEAALLIRSVAAEEMLHAALCSNLLLGLGGEPAFRSPDVVPTYPSLMSHHQPDLVLNLAPASQAHIRDVFMVIERPESHHAPAEPDTYTTLGQFYHALEIAIADLSHDHDLFANPQRDRQIAGAGFYSPVDYDAADSGGLVLVDDEASAREAIEIIVHQGEGLSEDRWADPAHQELTHYHKYKLIADGKVQLPGVLPAPINPRTTDLPERLRPVADLFNALYRAVFYTMDDIFSAKPDKAAAVGRLYRTMSRLMGSVARYLLSQPIGAGLVAAPTFEIHELDPDDPWGEIADMAAAVALQHTELAAALRALNGHD